MKYYEEDEEFVGSYLIIRKQSEELWIIENKDPELLGHLEKTRVGAWMSWCLTLEGGCYLSAGCQDEVREVTKQLNSDLHSNKKQEKEKTKVIILDDNILSLSSYAEEYPENWKKISESHSKSQSITKTK
jgi:hypothetical protein